MPSVDLFDVDTLYRVTMVKIHDKDFKLYMSEQEIKSVVADMAAKISHDLRDKNPIFCPTLTGAFMFASDLVRALDFEAEVCFVKYSSYSGMNTTGVVNSEMPFPAKCKGRHVVIVEDVVDTGITMDAVLADLHSMEPAGIYIASFFFKPDSFRKDFKIDYIGRSIPNDFIVGYGMDYDDRGRTLKDVYVLN